MLKDTVAEAEGPELDPYRCVLSRRSACSILDSSKFGKRNFGSKTVWGRFFVP